MHKPEPTPCLETQLISAVSSLCHCNLFSSEHTLNLEKWESCWGKTMCGLIAWYSKWMFWWKYPTYLTINQQWGLETSVHSLSAFSVMTLLCDCDTYSVALLELQNRHVFFFLPCLVEIWFLCYLCWIFHPLCVRTLNTHCAAWEIAEHVIKALR